MWSGFYQAGRGGRFNSLVQIQPHIHEKAQSTQPFCSEMALAPTVLLVPPKRMESWRHSYPRAVLQPLCSYRVGDGAGAWCLCAMAGNGRRRDRIGHDSGVKTVWKERHAQSPRAGVPSWAHVSVKWSSWSLGMLAGKHQ